MGCASVEKRNEGKVVIRDHNSPHKIVKVDGNPIEKRDGDGLLGYYFPELVIEPGQHEFTILYADEFLPFEKEYNMKHITVKATLAEGYYELAEAGNNLTFKPTEQN